jgi:hypothetical protein
MTEEYELNMKARVVEIDYDTSLIKQFMALNGSVDRDGNMFGAIIGQMPEGCMAFEPTRAKAVSACMHNWYNEIAVIPGKKIVSSGE